ncbi:MAG: DUF975 family protein [Clostridia bacterium]|nr:DUF975 family protein [Clostridia bacterium]
MWTREELKSNAKNVLRTTYWNAFLVSLVVSLLAGTRGGNISYSFPSKNGFGEFDIRIMGFVIAASLAVTLLSLVFRIFVGYAFEVSDKKFYISNTVNDSNISYLGYSFGQGRYGNILKTMLYRGVLIFLWTLLFIIPGIIKGYAYRMVPYILAENPEMDSTEALHLSEKMTMGHKLDMWVLDLSFIGWYLLGVLACGIGVLFVTPYQSATNVELYLRLKENIETEGIPKYDKEY